MVLGQLTPALVQTANDFVAAYDDDEAFAYKANGVFNDVKTKVDALHRVLGPWIVLLKRDIPGFEADRFGRSKRSPDDVIVGAKLLLEAVRGEGEGETSLPYAAALIEAVESALSQANQANEAAKLVRGERTEKRRAVREVAKRLHRELGRYRRALRGVIGAAHPDYQALRIRVRVRSEELLGDVGVVSAAALPAASISTKLN